MTLVEVMVSMFIFAIAVLGAYSLLLFGLRTMDQTRAFTQVSQILTHEMEAMRLRSWSGSADAAGKGQHSVKYLCDNAAGYSTFTPFADYRGGDVAPGSAQPALSTDVLGATTLQFRNANGFTCTRRFIPDASGESAEIVLTVSWVDSRKATHSRSYSSTVSKNGLNDSIFIARQ